MCFRWVKFGRECHSCSPLLSRPAPHHRGCPRALPGRLIGAEERALSRSFIWAEPDLFTKGTYVPLTVHGHQASHAVAFARRFGEIHSRHRTTLYVRPEGQRLAMWQLPGRKTI